MLNLLKSLIFLPGACAINRYTTGPTSPWKAGSHLQWQSSWLPSEAIQTTALLSNVTAPILWDWGNFLQWRNETNKCKCFLSTSIMLLQNKLYDMKCNGVFGSGSIPQPWNRLLNPSYKLRYGGTYKLTCAQVCYRHMSLNYFCSNNISVSTRVFLPWSRSSVIILLVWFQVLSINIIFFSLVLSLLLLEMHSFGFFSSSGSIFACLRSGSLEQSLSLAQTPFLVYFCRWKAISFTETELGPGNTSAIWMKITKRSKYQ